MRYSLILKLSTVLALEVFVSSCAVHNASSGSPPTPQGASILDGMGEFIQGRIDHVGKTLNRVAHGGPAITGPVYQGYFNGNLVTCQPGGMPTYSTNKGFGINPVPGLCDTLIASGQVRLVNTGAEQGQAGSAGASTGAVPADYRNIEQTEIYRIFEKYPQPGGGAFAAWPRVVITLVDAPAWHLDDKFERIGGMLSKLKPYPGNGCWKFKARIWESASKSRDVAPFYHCTGEQLRVPINNVLIAYQIWSGLFGTSMTRVTPGSTGIRHTEGAQLSGYASSHQHGLSKDQFW